MARKVGSRHWSTHLEVFCDFLTTSTRLKWTIGHNVASNKLIEADPLPGACFPFDSDEDRVQAWLKA
jgi:hypothetical protein